MNYEKQANDFAKKHGVKLTDLNLSRNGKSYTFDFDQTGVAGSKEPTMYDVLACLQKYDVGSFDDFCSEFGYNDLPLSAYERVNAIYEAVCEEFEAVQRLFGDVIEELQEIS